MCGPDGFFLTERSIELCPSLCREVGASSTGQLSIYGRCEEVGCDQPTVEVCDDQIDNDCDGFVDGLDVQCLL